MLSDVGPVANWRPIVNRPGAGPGKFLRTSHQPGLHWVVLNIPANPAKLRLVPNQMIVALMLPKRTREPENAISLQPSKSLQRLHEFRHIHKGRDQQMHVVGMTTWE
jgi:hypothetical protein